MFEGEPLSTKKVRVVIAKPGLDGHDTGAKVVAHALKEAGMEVIYTGLHRSVDEIVRTALEEDADVIGMSVYSGTHLHFSRKLMEQLQEKNLDDILALIGGNIPNKDAQTLKGFGVDGVFPVGSKLVDIVKFIKEKIEERK